MKSLNIERATQADAVWIFDEIGEGVQGGHFSESLVDDYQRMGMIAQVIVKNELRILKLRNGAATHVVSPADFWVAKQNGHPAGFLLTLYEGSKSQPYAVELHLAGTVREFRRRGIFQTLLHHQLLLSARAPRVFARCYSASAQAIRVLKEQGFVISKMGNPIELTLSN